MMHILIKAIPVRIREFITYVNKLHRGMEAGAMPLGVYNKKLYPYQAASNSCLLQLKNDSYIKY
ncbi:MULTISPECIES: hypothetical protein [Niastella]|uniref:Uncharacterized protein n=1 Tax=Niastella soli TaxID=2821487 RepID=A0ABS3YRL6_9BACT|nr:hypothetical protein [Niastella soli]MBO9200539.1 hypothetical protein [Niastella soli]